MPNMTQVYETEIPESQTGMEGISCFTCSVNSSGLETNKKIITVFTKQWMTLIQNVNSSSTDNPV